MHFVIKKAIEQGIKAIAKEKLTAKEYAQFVDGIDSTTKIRVGSEHKTLNDFIADHVEHIADYATNNKLSELSHQVQKKQEDVVASLKRAFGWA